jgi:hypothetical protein
MSRLCLAAAAALSDVSSHLPNPALVPECGSLEDYGLPVPRLPGSSIKMTKFADESTLELCQPSCFGESALRMFTSHLARATFQIGDRAGCCRFKFYGEQTCSVENSNLRAR